MVYVQCIFTNLMSCNLVLACRICRSLLGLCFVVFVILSFTSFFPNTFFGCAGRSIVLFFCRKVYTHISNICIYLFQGQDVKYYKLCNILHFTTTCIEEQIVNVMSNQTKKLYPPVSVTNTMEYIGIQTEVCYKHFLKSELHP